MKSDRDTMIEYRGFAFGHLLAAMLAGAAAGAAAAYFTAPASGADSRRRVRGAVDETRESVARVPVALKKATEAAREAFTKALADGQTHAS
jgi:gas vesicle protein